MFLNITGNNVCMPQTRPLRMLLLIIEFVCWVTHFNMVFELARFFSISSTAPKCSNNHVAYIDSMFTPQHIVVQAVQAQQFALTL